MDDIDVFRLEDKNKETQKEFELRREREKDDLTKVLRLPEGRRLLLRMLSEAGVFRASFTLNSMQTAFNEGKRDNGLWLMKELDEVNPMAFPQMTSEYYSELKSKKAKQEEKNG